MRYPIAIVTMILLMSCSKQNFNDFIFREYKTGFFGVKGNVKTLKETRYYEVELINDSVVYNKPLVYYFEFNKQGMLSRKTDNAGMRNEIVTSITYQDLRPMEEISTLSKDQSVIKHKIYTYKKGRLEKISLLQRYDTSYIALNYKKHEIHFINPSFNNRKTESVYTLNGNYDITEETFLLNGVTEQHKVYEYHENYNELRVYNTHNDLMYTEKTVFYPNSNIPKIEETIVHGEKLLQPKTKEFDKNGNEIKQTVYRDDTTVMFQMHWAYKYDGHDNWTEQKNFKNDKLYTVFRREITYY